MNSNYVIKYFLVFLTNFLISTFSFSATPYIKNYSVEDGLPYIQVNAVIRDNAGFLWTGGYGGLSRFDGKKFTNFSPSDGLSNYAVTSIIQLQDNSIVAGTIKGISIFKNGAFKNIYVPNKPRCNVINSVYATSDNKIVASTMGGIVIHHSNNFQVFDKSNGLLSDTVYNVLVLNKRFLIVATASGIQLFNLEKKVCEKSFSPFVGAEVKKVFLSTDGKEIYILSKGSLYKASFSIYKMQIGKSERILVDENINDFYVKNNQIISIASDNGLYRYENGNITNFQLGNTLNSNLVSSIFHDEEDIVWMGTYDGVFKYKPNGFIRYEESDGLTYNYIFQIIKDQKNNLWATSGGAGVYLKNQKNQFKNFSKKDGLTDDFVWCAVQKNDELLFGSNNGISVFKNNRFTNAFPQFKNIAVFSMLYESDGILWVGSRGCIYQVKNNETRKYILSNVYGDCDVSSIYKDSKGNIWVGAYQGSLYKLEGDQFADYAKKWKLKSESFLTISEDSLGNIYFGSFDGIYVFKNGKLYNISTKNGLSSNLVYSFAIDKKQNLWVGTNQGLNYISINDFFSGKKNSIRIFSKSDGFIGGECNTGGLLIDENNDLYIGTVNGLSKFNPSKYQENTYIPKVHIIGLSIFYRDTFLNDKVELNYTQNNLRFSFIGLSLTNPEKVQYTYRLKGFDKKWSPYTINNQAFYSNIPPGNYIFEVKASNDNGIWNEKPARIEIIIKPPFWRTWWFIAISFLAIFAIGFIVIRARLNYIRKKDSEKLQNQIEKANFELKALRAQMNPHFIFNSLNSIQHLVRINDTNSATKFLSKFSKLIRQILHHSEETFISLTEEINTLQLYLELETMRFKNKFTYEIIIPEGLEADFIKIPSMIIQPYVENAIIHGIGEIESGGKIEISFEQIAGNRLKCIINDNGIGIDEAFKRKQSNSLHKSMAGKISSERLEILKKLFDAETGVEITDKSIQGKRGTQVVLILPVN